MTSTPEPKPSAAVDLNIDLAATGSADRINFSRPVKTGNGERVVVLTFVRERADRQTQLHAVGCKHAAKADDISKEQDAADVVRTTLTTYRDDYYYVAPCAAARRSGR